MDNPRLTLEQFTPLFVEAMMAQSPIGNTFDDGVTVQDYAHQVAESYWANQHLEDGTSPEDCAAADISYWGEE